MIKPSPDGRLIIGLPRWVNLSDESHQLKSAIYIITHDIAKYESLTECGPGKNGFWSENMLLEENIVLVSCR